MTPKEKAKELVNSFYQPLGYLKCSVCSDEMWEHAKQCALIAVDEVITSLGKLNVEILHIGIDFSNLITELRSDYNLHIIYWNEVKKEIEKL